DVCLLSRLAGSRDCGRCWMFLRSSPIRGFVLLLVASAFCDALALEPLHYNNPGLPVDLSVGLWGDPLPMDFDGDGNLDLVVNCPDRPYNGLYFFRNATGDTARNPFPVFRRAQRISRGTQNVQISYVDGKPVVLSPAT